MTRFRSESRWARDRGLAPAAPLPYRPSRNNAWARRQKQSHPRFPCKMAADAQAQSYRLGCRCHRTGNRRRGIVAEWLWRDASLPLLAASNAVSIHLGQSAVELESMAIQGFAVEALDGGWRSRPGGPLLYRGNRRRRYWSSWRWRDGNRCRQAAFRSRRNGS